MQVKNDADYLQDTHFKRPLSVFSRVFFILSLNRLLMKKISNEIRKSLGRKIYKYAINTFEY